MELKKVMVIFLVNVMVLDLRHLENILAHLQTKLFQKIIYIVWIQNINFQLFVCRYILINYAYLFLLADKDLGLNLKNRTYQIKIFIVYNNFYILVKS